MDNFYITKQPSIEGKKFKFIGMEFESFNIDPEEFQKKKNYLQALILHTLKERKCNAAVNVDISYTDITKWGNSTNYTAYPYDQFGMAVLSFSYGIVSDYKECEDFTLLSTQDAPGKKFEVSSSNIFWIEADGTSDEQISTALSKLCEEIEDYVLEGRYNCAVGFNPDIKPYITPNGEQKCIISASVTYGMLYE